EESRPQWAAECGRMKGRQSKMSMFDTLARPDPATGSPARKRLLLHRTCAALFVRRAHFVELVDDDLLFVEIRPVVFVEPRGVFQILLVQIEGQVLLVLVDSDSFPRHGKVLIPDAGKSSKIQHSVLNIALPRINHEV